MSVAPAQEQVYDSHFTSPVWRSRGSLMEGCSIPVDRALQPHPDQHRIVEDHQQTEHKLELYRRYAQHWASILSRAHGRGLDTSHLFLIDGFAGGGIHASRDHPDRTRPGTAILACHTARAIQRRFQNEVHVRLVDRNPEYCRTLIHLTNRFRQGTGHEVVDVEVICSEFTGAVQELFIETEPTRRQFRSLWFLDPYGSSGFPHDALSSLDRARGGPEVIINFDTGGVRRVCGDGNPVTIDPQHRAHLDELFGSRAWTRAFDPTIGDAREALVHIYRERFSGFRSGGCYQLRQSDGQLRHFVHLAKTPRAESAFKEDYDASFRTGLLAGRSLNEADRSVHARRLFEVFRGETLTLEEMYALRVQPLDRGQLMTVLRHAERDGFGHWDEAARIMRWERVRVEPPELLLDFK